jgi:hypothetical protein
MFILLVVKYTLDSAILQLYPSQAGGILSGQRQLHQLR